MDENRVTPQPEDSRTTQVHSAGEEQPVPSQIRVHRVTCNVVSPLTHKPVTIKVKGLTVVGREERSKARKLRPDFDLSDFEATQRGVSRRHAVLLSDGEVLNLIDLYSMNGTRLNGSLLVPGEKYALQSGDVIAFGQVLIEVNRIDVEDDGPDRDATSPLAGTRILD